MKSTIVSESALKGFARAHNNSLYDAVALLAAVVERIESDTRQTFSEDRASDTARLVSIASERVKGVADALFDAGAADMVPTVGVALVAGKPAPAAS